MKATGIVRRIDDIGRVVIHKGIRRTMRIRKHKLTIHISFTQTVIFCDASIRLAEQTGTS